MSFEIQGLPNYSSGVHQIGKNSGLGSVSLKQLDQTHLQKDVIPSLLELENCFVAITNTTDQQS